MKRLYRVKGREGGKGKERPLLWERGAHAAPEDVATPTITTIESQQGDENSSRTKSQSNVSSAGKGSEQSAAVQRKGEKGERYVKGEKW